MVPRRVMEGLDFPFRRITHRVFKVILNLLLHEGKWQGGEMAKNTMQNAWNTLLSPGQSKWLFVLPLDTIFLKKDYDSHFFLSFTQWVKTIAILITALIGYLRRNQCNLWVCLWVCVYACMWACEKETDWLTDFQRREGCRIFLIFSF